MRIAKYSIFFILGFIFFFVIRLWSFANQTLKISVLKALFTKSGVRTIDNYTNILILGVPGSTFDGPELTDTIIVLNYNFDKNRAILFGIPRDIWSNTLKDKVNSAYVYGEAIKKGGGLTLAKAEIGSIIGMPIQYGIVVDFDDYIKIVDYLEGITIEVEQTFVDNRYPIKGKEDDDCLGDEEFKCRYETVKFKKGLNKMDGELALKFIRSRNAIGSEGNDFARIKRQQIVINSIQRKAFDYIGFFNINKMKDFYNLTNGLLEKDITNQQSASILKNIVFARNFKTLKKTIPDDLFFSPEYSSYDGRYVLVPKNDDYSNIHKYVEESLN